MAHGVRDEAGGRLWLGLSLEITVGESVLDFFHSRSCSDLDRGSAAKQSFTLFSLHG
jgi:hypothetical protein